MSHKPTDINCIINISTTSFKRFKIFFLTGVYHEQAMKIYFIASDMTLKLLKNDVSQIKVIHFYQYMPVHYKFIGTYTIWWITLDRIGYAYWFFFAKYWSFKQKLICNIFILMIMSRRKALKMSSERKKKSLCQETSSRLQEESCVQFMAWGDEHIRLS